MAEPTADPTRCPLCGAPNACGAAQGAATCWCFDAAVPADVRARVPDGARDRACVCERCAASLPGDAGASAPEPGLRGVPDPRRS